ncbi:putative cytoplasmic protein [Escherichia coli]|uniref:Putative cytoplasmic protein n=1 Tax=Escherichia coli TaxID=562 RepID=A0A377K6M2_ECOLX|nr:putative cytoplasmic protein [Escherichia coli]
MSHLDEVIARVDAAIEESVIAHMNELLIALSDDAELSREDRYTPAAAFAHRYCSSRSQT